MGYQIEGSEQVGFRVVDDDAGPLTGRCPTVEKAMERAGVVEQKRGPGRPKKTD